MRLLRSELLLLAARQATRGWALLAVVAAGALVAAALAGPPPDVRLSLGWLCVGLAIAAYLVGAGSAGGDLARGTAAGLLLLRPERIPVLAAKLAVVVATALALVALVAGAYLIAGMAAGDPGDTGWPAALGQAVRGAALTAAAAATGFAVAVLGQGTRQALAALLGYAAVEFAAAAVLTTVDGVGPWRLTAHVRAWLDGGAADPATVGPAPAWIASGLVLATVTAVLVTAATLAFARRDLTRWWP